MPTITVALRAAPTAHAPRHHVRLRECAPGVAVAPLADLDSDNVAAIYLLPYAGPGGGPFSNDASASVASPAESSGLDLPVGGTTDVGAIGGGSGDFIGLPPGLGGGSGSPGGGGGGGSGGGGAGGGGSGPSGGGGGGGGGGGSGPPGGGGVPTVPEPATWALMLIGVGSIGAFLRRGRRLAISA